MRGILHVVAEPLSGSLAELAYTANTATWYSVRALRCCKTTELSLPSTTAWETTGEEGARMRKGDYREKGKGRRLKKG